MEVPPNADDDETMRSSANIVDTMFALAKDLTRLLIEVLVALTFDAPNDQALSLAGWYRICFPGILLKVIYRFVHIRRAARTAPHCSTV